MGEWRPFSHLGNGHVQVRTGLHLRFGRGKSYVSSYYRRLWYAITQGTTHMVTVAIDLWIQFVANLLAICSGQIFHLPRRDSAAGSSGSSSAIERFASMSNRSSGTTLPASSIASMKIATPSLADPVSLWLAPDKTGIDAYGDRLT